MSVQPSAPCGMTQWHERLSLRDGCRLRLFRPTPHSKTREPLVIFASPNFGLICPMGWQSGWCSENLLLIRYKLRASRVIRVEEKTNIFCISSSVVKIQRRSIRESVDRSDFHYTFYQNRKFQRKAHPRTGGDFFEEHRSPLFSIVLKEKTRPQQQYATSFCMRQGARIYLFRFCEPPFDAAAPPIFGFLSAPAPSIFGRCWPASIFTGATSSAMEIGWPLPPTSAEERAATSCSCCSSTR